MNFLDRIKCAVKEAATTTVGTLESNQGNYTDEIPKQNFAGKLYFDYASTTPVDPDVSRAMRPYLELDFYNPSSIYAEGVRMKSVINESRKHIASLMNVQSDEIIFTSSGTESNNLAIWGTVHAYSGKGRPHIITSTIEHPSVLETCRAVEAMGVEVTYISPDSDGVIDPEEVKKAITKKTILVSIMYVNNEIGTIQPVGNIGRMISEIRDKKQYPYFHVDASQAGNYLSIHSGQIGADLITLDATKVYGPRGVGLLCVRKNVTLEPLFFGGGQERGLRSGTENTAGIVGFDTALTLAQNTRENEGERIFALRELLITELKQRFLNIIIHGEKAVCVPNILNVCIPDIDAEFVVIKMDHEGVMLSSASACASNSEENFSTTVSALPEVGEICKRSSLRFSMGRYTTEEDVEKLVDILEKVLSK